MSQPYDTNGDGIADAWIQDSNGDGRPDTVGFDRNQDGIYDGVAVDQDGDGFSELIGVDSNQDGVYELIQMNGQLATDTNGDGAADSWSPSTTTSVVGGNNASDYTVQGDTYVPSGIVGGTPSYDGVGGLILDIADETGTATFGTPDSDADGYNDAIDHRPYDDDFY